MTPHLLSIDPGLRGCGAAYFYAGRLSWCAYVRSGSTRPDLLGALDMARAVAASVPAIPATWPLTVAVEWPQVYIGSRQKGDANDLANLAAVDAAILTYFGHATVVRYRPAEWKGQVPKAIMGARIRAKLVDAERCILDGCGCPKSLMHNVLDGIGIGLFFLGRPGR